MTGAEVVTEARGWVDPVTVWQHQQSLKGVATDCLGLIGGVAVHLGVPGSKRWRTDPRARGYGTIPSAPLILKLCDEYLVAVPLLAARALGDILFMVFADRPQHFAIVSCLDPLRIIHAYAGIGRVAENGVDAKWRAKIVRVWRYPGLDADA